MAHYAEWFVVGVVLFVGTAASLFAWFGGKHIDKQQKKRD
jgi:hypothetical protein